MAVLQKRGRDATEEGTAKRVAALRAASVNPLTKAQIEQNDPDRPLSAMQIEFAKLWAQGESPRSAALRAGYAETCADSYSWKLKNDPAILKIYHVEKKLYEDAVQMTRKRFMEGLLDAADCAKLMAEPASMVAAWREIGKACGYYEPVKMKIDLNITGNLMVDRLTKLSDAELLKLIEAPAIEGESERVPDDDLEA